jgi:prepilin peptidase CpaA
MIYPAAALICALIGSKWDIREHRIPNLLTGPSILVGLLLHGILGGWSQLSSSLMAGLIAGGICALFYFAGGMGAGDVKLMIAVGCLMGLYPLRLMLLATAFAGSSYALVLAIKHRQLSQTLTNVAAIVAHHGREGLTPHPDLNVTNPRTLRLPFAVPIAAGCCVAAISAFWRH